MVYCRRRVLGNLFTLALLRGSAKNTPSPIFQHLPASTRWSVAPIHDLHATTPDASRLPRTPLPRSKNRSLCVRTTVAPMQGAFCGPIVFRPCGGVWFRCWDQQEVGIENGDNKRRGKNGGQGIGLGQKTG
ncbi:hypothetical protein F5878DRAFT_628197 [Lentinula raphanica]|uniref:Uncharacterized protein n=1 Tax=Lentinula raphanica TaxID=153919 RepID=A0AA38P3A0_9AGAR|nr:hypothetical protein F5878DRAFT_628197 [Lentinula raphanica]